MEELDKWKTINGAESVPELVRAIRAISEGNPIASNRQDRTFDVERQVQNAAGVIRGVLPARALTRNYGIRQQALYLHYYQKLEQLEHDREHTDSTLDDKFDNLLGL